MIPTYERIYMDDKAESQSDRCRRIKAVTCYSILRCWRYKDVGLAKHTPFMPTQSSLDHTSQHAHETTYHIGLLYSTMYRFIELETPLLFLAYCYM